MKNSIQIVLWVCTLALVVFALIAVSKISEPKIDLTFQTQTDEAGHYIAFFAVTNIGNVSVISYNYGFIEKIGQSDVDQVVCDSKHYELQPGQGDIIKVYLPAANVKRWRFTMFYTRERSNYLFGPAKHFARSEWIK
jgi:hypothetical protein